jgi:hypothetical protein
MATGSRSSIDQLRHLAFNNGRTAAGVKQSILDSLNSHPSPHRQGNSEPVRQRKRSVGLYILQRKFLRVTSLIHMRVVVALL